MTGSTDHETGALPESLVALAVAVDTLRPHPRNVRRGDVDTIAESLRRHGQYRPIVVNRRTSEILAGNHTWQAARTLGWTEIAATYVDVDDDEALRILLVDNKTNDDATYDEPGLLAMLSDIAATDAGLDGTGFDDGELAKLLARLGPDPDDDVSPQMGALEYRVLVACESEEHQRALIEQFEQGGLTVQALIS